MWIFICAKLTHPSLLCEEFICAYRLLDEQNNIHVNGIYLVIQNAQDSSAAIY